MKVLLALDGSKHSMVALDALIERLDWFAEPPVIDLVTVHAAVPYPGAVARVGKETMQQYYDDECEAALKPAEARLAGKDIAYEKVKLVGDPAAEIVRHAVTRGCDLIVMGTHGHTALSNLVLGSVATKVLASTKVPVLLLRQ